MQMLQMIAYWSILLQMPVYVSQKDIPGGLHWDQAIKGTIFLIWAVFQNISPLISGIYLDRHAYRKLMFFALSFGTSGFIILSFSNTIPFFILGVIILGVGLGMFKPLIQGLMAETIGESATATGWGIYFMLLNISVMIGSLLSQQLREISFPAVFWGSSVVFALNFVIFIFLDKKLLINITNRFDEYQSCHSELGSVSILKFKDGFRGKPGMTEKEIIEKEHFSSKSFFKLLFDKKVFPLVLLMSGFFTIFMQFYETLPNFILDWTDTSGIVQYLNLPHSMTMLTSRGRMISYEWFYVLNSILIIFSIVLVSNLLKKYRKLNVLRFGIVLASCGLLLCGISYLGLLALIGVIVYTYGEMITNPKYTEIMGEMATEGDKIKYMSMMSISPAIGYAIGSLSGGFIYRHFSEKAMLAQRYLTEHFGNTNLSIDLTKSFDILCQKTGLDPFQTTSLLWNEYHPYITWIIFFLFGIFTVIGFWLWEKKAGSNQISKQIVFKINSK